METGVCPEWLLQNDPATSPVAAESRLPFNNAFFSKYRENLRTTKPTMVDPLVEVSSEALPAFVHCVARHFQAVRSSPDEVKRLSEWLKNAASIVAHEFPISERRNSAELDRTALELCRITARAWAPRRKGYKRAEGKTTTPSTSLEDIEHHEEGKRAQVVPVRRGKLRG